MRQEEIHVVETHILKAFVKAQLDSVRMSEMRPKLGRHEYLRALDSRFSDRSAHFFVYLLAASATH